jgi:hypothetical protein
MHTCTFFLRCTELAQNIKIYPVLMKSSIHASSIPTIDNIEKIDCTLALPACLVLAE